MNNILHTSQNRSGSCNFNNDFVPVWTIYFCSPVLAYCLSWLGSQIKSTQLRVSRVWAAVSADTRYGSLLKVNGDKKKKSKEVQIQSYSHHSHVDVSAFPLPFHWGSCERPSWSRLRHARVTLGQIYRSLPRRFYIYTSGDHEWEYRCSC